MKQVGRELGVRYVLEGSVRKGGNRVRITAQLIEAETGTHLWADRFDGPLEDIFDLQDQVAVDVAGAEPTLQSAEVHRSAARPTSDITAYDLYLRAVATFYPVAKDRVYSALGLLEQAIGIDPYYGPALSWAAVCYMRLVNDGWTVMPRIGEQLQRRDINHPSRHARRVSSLMQTAGTRLSQRPRPARFMADP